MLVKSIQAIRGMNDLLPEVTPYWQHLEKACADLASCYGYQEIRLPVVEHTGLFKRTIGEATDIVEKEMYTFEDRNGDSLTLRPEGTAGCVRAGIQQGLLYNQVQRFWYLGPMFRHERPQKGRYRQFHQFGVEAFGMMGPDIDAEHILMNQRLWKILDLSDQVELQLNNLGTLASRAQYREDLISFYQKHHDQLDEDSQRRLTSNPLRILDSKNSVVTEINQQAPTLLEYLDKQSRQHFDNLRRLLDELEVPYRVNPYLVRGLDYYGLTVYEWITHELGTQGTVSAGGHYDALVEQLGGKTTPAVGFAIGLERLVLLMQERQARHFATDVCFVLMGEQAVLRGLKFAEQLRQQLPGLQVETNLSAGGFKSQFKRADKSGARWALIIGEDELQTDTISVKDLRGKVTQQQLPLQEVIKFLKVEVKKNETRNDRSRTSRSDQEMVEGLR